MGSLKMKSVRDTFALELGPPEGKSGDGWFQVRLTGPVVASVKAYDNHYGSLTSFFADLATHWNRPVESLSWGSLESHVVLDAKFDRLGHIYLKVTLRDVDAPAAWRVETTLVVEAGQLEEIAKIASA